MPYQLMTPGSEDGCKEAGYRFTSDSSCGGSWFRSRPAEAMHGLEEADDDPTTDELGG